PFVLIRSSFIFVPGIEWRESGIGRRKRHSSLVTRHSSLVCASGDLSYFGEPFLAWDRCLQRNIEQAGRAMIWPNRAQRRHCLIAFAADKIIAARAERADLRQINQIRRQPPDGCKL